MTDTPESFSKAKVIYVHDWAPGLFSIILQPPEPFSFIAGQYLRVACDNAGEFVIRPYSIASASDSETIELYITVSYDDEHQGVMSSYLSRLVVGDELLIDCRQAYGYLTLDEVPQADSLWMLASGVGLAPFLSIIRTSEVFQRFCSIYLVHSTRYINELGYKNELVEKQKKHAGFHYLPFVTREKASGLFSGRITEALRTGELEKTTDCPIDTNCQFMICGNPGLIDEGTALLRDRGLERNRRRRPGNITVEKFW